jgi:hypothetical protein
MSRKDRGQITENHRHFMTEPQKIPFSEKIENGIIQSRNSKRTKVIMDKRNPDNLMHLNIISLNVGSIRSQLKQSFVKELLETAKPDMLLLQETKHANGAMVLQEFPSVWSRYSHKGGVSVLLKQLSYTDKKKSWGNFLCSYTTRAQGFSITMFSMYIDQRLVYK